LNVVNLGKLGQRFVHEVCNVINHKIDKANELVDISDRTIR